MRRLLLLSVLALALTVIGGGARVAASVGAAGPRIAAPQANPSRPLPGKRFDVSFSLRSAAGRPLTAAILVFEATIAGKAVAHTDSFSHGVARSQIDVPASAGGKRLSVTLTVHVGASAATRHAQYTVRAAPTPSLAIEDATVSEGNAGTSVLNFPVTLSAASATAVSVAYATIDGTASAPDDYQALRGKLVFSPGETTKSISVIVNGDTLVESDETMDVLLSRPHGVRIIRTDGTGTILNDDVPAAATAGNYQGATPEGNYVFLAVLPNRTVTGFRTNSLTLHCNPPGIYLQGAVAWGDATFSIGDDGSWTGQFDWTGSDVQGDEEFTQVSSKVSGKFTSPTTIAGSVYLLNAVNIKGTHYVCSSTTSFTLTLQS